MEVTISGMSPSNHTRLQKQAGLCVRLILWLNNTKHGDFHIVRHADMLYPVLRYEVLFRDTNVLITQWPIPCNLIREVSVLSEDIYWWSLSFKLSDNSFVL